MRILIHHNPFLMYLLKSATEGDETKGKIYWDGTTFPDATLSKEQEEALKEIVSKALDPMVRVKEFVLEESTVENILNRYRC